MSIISDEEWNKHVQSIAHIHGLPDSAPTEDTPTNRFKDDKYYADLKKQVGQQDDKQLREAIAEIVVLNRNGTMLGRSQSIDDLLALFTTAQLQLVTELLEHSDYYITSYADGEEHIEAVPVSALEHKKQELERGK